MPVSAPGGRAAGQANPRGQEAAGRPQNSSAAGGKLRQGRAGMCPHWGTQTQILTLLHPEERKETSRGARRRYQNRQGRHKGGAPGHGTALAPGKSPVLVHWLPRGGGEGAAAAIPGAGRATDGSPGWLRPGWLRPAGFKVTCGAEEADSCPSSPRGWETPRAPLHCLLAPPRTRRPRGRGQCRSPRAAARQKGDGALRTQPLAHQHRGAGVGAGSRGTSAPGEGPGGVGSSLAMAAGITRSLGSSMELARHGLASTTQRTQAPREPSGGCSGYPSIVPPHPRLPCLGSPAGEQPDKQTPAGRRRQGDLCCRRETEAGQGWGAPTRLLPAKGARSRFLCCSPCRGDPGTRGSRSSPPSTASPQPRSTGCRAGAHLQRDAPLPSTLRGDPAPGCLWVLTAARSKPGGCEMPERTVAGPAHITGVQYLPTQLRGRCSAPRASAWPPSWCSAPQPRA